MKVISPSTGQVIEQIEVADAAAVEAALVTADRVWQDRSQWLPLHERCAVLERTAELISEQHEALAQLIAAEGGKPLLDARIEVTRAIDSVRQCAEHVKNDTGSAIPMGASPASANRLAFTRKVPIGIVLAVSAFNHPLNLIAHQVAPAVAAGCPVIVKPADDTPLSCLKLVSLLHEAGLPASHAQALVIDDLQLAERLVTDERLSFFSFIGSARVGWMLRSKLAPGVRCALEHGGAAPVIVAADADLDDAVPLITKGGFYHAGQVCVSVQRVFADRSIADDLIVRLKSAIEALKVGDASDPTTEVGPLIRPQEVDRVEDWVNQAVESGSELVTGGARINESFYRPTLLVDPPADATVSTHEIFGPVVNVYRYDDLDAALTMANALPFSFQGAVFTRSLDTAMACFEGLDASAVMVNDHSAFRIDGMPFAGLRQSGLGTGGVPYTLEDMQVEKMMVIRSAQIR